MRAAAKEVSINGLVDTKRTPRVGKRRNWPEGFKRQVVAETLGIERAGFIDIEFGCGARVCIRGEVAPKTLRQVIELLR